MSLNLIALAEAAVTVAQAHVYARMQQGSGAISMHHQSAAFSSTPPPLPVYNGAAPLSIPPALAERAAEAEAAKVAADAAVARARRAYAAAAAAAAALRAANGTADAHTLQDCNGGHSALMQRNGGASGMGIRERERSPIRGRDNSGEEGHALLASGLQIKTHSSFSSLQQQQQSSRGGSSGM